MKVRWVGLVVLFFTLAGGSAWAQKEFIRIGVPDEADLQTLQDAKGDTSSANQGKKRPAPSATPTPDIMPTPTEPERIWPR